MFTSKRHTTGLIYRPVASIEPTIPQPSDTERQSYSRAIIRPMSKPAYAAKAGGMTATLRRKGSCGFLQNQKTDYYRSISSHLYRRAWAKQQKDKPELFKGDQGAYNSDEDP